VNVSESLQKYGLVPSDESLPHIRELLAKEAAAERNDLPREEDLALLCCVQLFSRGHLEDVLRIWDAKQSGFDLSCYLDIQLLCGAGLEATKRFLSSQERGIAAEALQYLRECEQSGDFDEFSPDTYLEGYRRYFGAA
jgi:hypothetical protein